MKRDVSVVARPAEVRRKSSRERIVPGKKGLLKSSPLGIYITYLPI